MTVVPRPVSHSPRVSVLVATYNRARVLCRAVQSVLSQTFDDFELVIIDDCSTDGTPIATAAFDDPRISVLRHPENRGQGAAFNTGLLHARGEYIAFLDDDDEWMPTKLEKQVALMEAATETVGLVYCWTDRLDDLTGRITRRSRERFQGDIFEDMLALSVPTPTSSLMVRRTAALQVGGWNEQLKIARDPDFVTRVVAAGYHVDYTPESLTLVHIHSAQVSAQPYEHLRMDYFRDHAERYASALERHPRARALLNLRMAYMEFKRNRWRAAVPLAARAFMISPLGLLRGVLSLHSCRYVLGDVFRMMFARMRLGRR